jgi:transcriptional regulator of nitric oxide reductase
MADKYIADTAILHDGELTPEGEVVKESDFGSDAWEQLVEAGSVRKEVKTASEENADAEKAALEQRVKDLEAQLEAAKKPNTEVKTTPAPAGK